VRKLDIDTVADGKGRAGGADLPVVHGRGSFGLATDIVDGDACVTWRQTRIAGVANSHGTYSPRHGSRALTGIAC